MNKTHFYKINWYIILITIYKIYIFNPCKSQKTFDIHQTFLLNLIVTTRENVKFFFRQKSAHSTSIQWVFWLPSVASLSCYVYFWVWCKYLSIRFNRRANSMICNLFIINFLLVLVSGYFRNCTNSIIIVKMYSN